MYMLYLDLQHLFLWVMQLSTSGHLSKSLNKQLNLTSTALLRLRLNATLAQTNQLRSGSLAGRYMDLKSNKL